MQINSIECVQMSADQLFNFIQSEERSTSLDVFTVSKCIEYHAVLEFISNFLLRIANKMA